MPRKKIKDEVFIDIKPQDVFIDYGLGVSDSNYILRGQYEGFFESFTLLIWGYVILTEDYRIPVNYNVLLKFSPDDDYGYRDEDGDISTNIGHVYKRTKEEYIKLEVNIPRRSFNTICTAALSGSIKNKIRVKTSKLDYNRAVIRSVWI